MSPPPVPVIAQGRSQKVAISKPLQWTVKEKLYKADISLDNVTKLNIKSIRKLKT